VAYDAVVVGAGPNGLVGALTLARAGRRVLVLEAADRVGGALRTEELTLPGFRHDVGATVLALAAASPAFRALGVPDALWAQPPVPLAHPLDGGAALLHRGIDDTTTALGRDARAWQALVAASARPDLIDAVLSLPRPAAVAYLARRAPRFALTAALPAAAATRIGFRDMGTQALFAGLAAHSELPLRALVTTGYAIVLGALAHLTGWPFARGGSGALVDQLVDSLRDAGAEIVTGNRVRSLAQLPPARTTLLDLTPRQVLAVAGERLPPRYRARLARYRYGPGVFKLDWALDAPVPWRDQRVAQAGTVHLGGTADQIAAAERDVARGRHPDRPFVICTQPSVADASRAPAGKHVLWAYCHVPNGSSRDMTSAIEDAIERAAPGFRDRVLARHVFTPSALEAFDANLVGGDIGGGAADLRQLLARPVLSTRPWATPVPGLYLCSAATPPGGGSHGMGGYQAAHLALRHHP
jgi:phytoene dehydrogenase-like protein